MTEKRSNSANPDDVVEFNIASKVFIFLKYKKMLSFHLTVKKSNSFYLLTISKPQWSKKKKILELVFW